MMLSAELTAGRYLAPSLRWIEVAPEQGVAATDPVIERPVVDPDEDEWW